MIQDRVISVFGPSFDEIEVGKVINVAKNTPLVLDSGAEINDFPVAFETYGELNADKSNAILVCHGLTGDQYAASKHPVTGKPGWWELLIGPDKPLDTNRFFIICPNVLGGCLGSFGPKDTDPKTGEAYALTFPVITIRDQVNAHALLVEALGIDILFSVIGGSMGGMHVLQWSVSYPDKIRTAIPIATGSRHTAQNIAFHEIGRQAIIADPDWRDGNYLQEKTYPSKGLAVARMTAHVTYLSESGLGSKFGRRLQDRDSVSFGFEADFQVESYLRHQGNAFVNRFDPNSYLYITRAMDYFDLEADYGSLGEAFKDTKAAFCIVSFSSDWLFPTIESKRIVQGLTASNSDVAFVEIETDMGHDAFLLDEPKFYDVIEGFIEKNAKKWGL